MKNLVDDIEAIRQKLQLKKIHVLGHSWGGFLAVKYAAAYPENVNRILLSDPMPPSTTVWQAEEQELAKRITHYDSLQRSLILNSEAMKNKDDKCRQCLDETLLQNTICRHFAVG